MAKTYTLTATSIHCGYHSSISSGYWDNLIGADGNGYMVGKYGNFYRMTNLMFDQTTLASLRSKTVTSITLTLTLANAARIKASGWTVLPIGYKYNSLDTKGSTCDAWARSNSASTAKSTDVVGYVRSQGDEYQAAVGDKLAIPMSGVVPVYGYVLGATTAATEYNMVKISAATLTVVTNETDYTLKLSYNANNGSGAPSAQSATVTTSGTPSYTFTISSTRPTRTGYNFLGWSTSSTATSASYQPSGSITISANTTLYAVWQQITYTVSYNKGSSGTGTNTTATKYYGTALTLKGAIFTRTGYTQTGWSTSDGGSMAYGLSASYTANAAVTLYPYWTINTYAVTYNKGSNGTGTNTSDTKTYGTALTLKGAIFTRTGYTQTGWSTSDGGSKAYNLSASYTTNAAVTLYPFWTINTYTVSYKKGASGTGTETTDTKTYNTALTLKGAIFTRTGYTQTGWSTSDGGALAYALSGSYTANSAVTLYPYWTINTYTISYNKGSSGSGTNTSDTKTYGTALTLKGAIFTRTGYAQTGWSTSDGGAKAYDISGSYTTNASATLYPYWTLNTYTITYNANGGSGAPSAQTKSYGIDLTLSATIPTNGVMQFLGWAETDYAVEAQYQPSGTFTKNQNTVLYAVWGVSNTTVRVMGSDGSLHQYPIYYMSNNGLVSASVYYMGSDGVLHPQQ